MTKGEDGGGQRGRLCTRTTARVLSHPFLHRSSTSPGSCVSPTGKLAALHRVASCEIAAAVFFPQVANDATCHGERTGECADSGRDRGRGTRISEVEERVEFISRSALGRRVGAPYSKDIALERRSEGEGSRDRKKEREEEAESRG